VLLQHFWWGSVFLINVPIAVIAMIGACLAINESKAPNPAPIDPVGVALSALGLTALTYALIVAPNKHWGSATVLGSLVLSAALLTAFFMWDGKRSNPLIDLALFRNPRFSSGIAAVTSLFFAMFGVSFLLSQYIQFVQRASVFSVGLRFLPMALGSVIASNTSARLTHVFGLRRVLLTGMGLVVLGLALFTTVTASSGFLTVGIAFTFVGIGMGLAIAPASTAVVGALPEDKVGVGSGLRTTVQWLGGSFAVAIVGTIATSHYRSHVNAAYDGTLRAVPVGQRQLISEQIGRAVLAARHLPADLAARVTAVADHAFVGGMRIAAVIAAAAAFLALLAVARYVPADIEFDDEEAKLSAAG
jgi:predicted MFS family arabinose efflux permease